MIFALFSKVVKFFQAQIFVFDFGSYIHFFFKNAFGQVLIFDLLLLKAVTWDTRLATMPFLISTLFAFFCFFFGVMILFFCFVGDMFYEYSQNSIIKLF